MRRLMLSEIVTPKKITATEFQVLYLRNDASQEVEVHDVKTVDFFTVQQRLEHGESVFITSRNAQKIKAPKPRSPVSRSLKAKLVSAFYMEGV